MRVVQSHPHIRMAHLGLPVGERHANLFPQSRVRLPDHVPTDPRLDRGTLTILRSGFPMTLDGSRESVPADQIQLTRALLLGGVLQALEVPSDDHHAVMLSPQLQARLTSIWFDLYPDRCLWYPEAV